MSEIATEGQVEVDPRREPGVFQLDDGRLGGQLRALNLEHRKQIDAAGAVLEHGDPHGV